MNWGEGSSLRKAADLEMVLLYEVARVNEKKKRSQVVLSGIVAIATLEDVYVVSQFYPWFNFLFFSFKLIIINYHTQKQKKIKIKPRVNLYHNVHTKPLIRLKTLQLLCNIK